MDLSQVQVPWHEEVLDLLARNNGTADLGHARVLATQSESDEMAFYYVIQFENGRTVCTCKGFRYKDKCKHV